jgi:hypothetical protein
MDRRGLQTLDTFAMRLPMPSMDYRRKTGIHGKLVSDACLQVLQDRAICVRSRFPGLNQLIQLFAVHVGIDLNPQWQMV